MNRLFSIFLFSLIAIIPVQSQQIILDEDISDWAEINTEFIDPSGDGVGIDLLRFKITNDDQFLYFFIELNAEFDIQENNDLVLYIDTDNNVETGTLFNEIGYDFRFTLGNRQGTFGSSSVSPYQIGLVSSPTVTSTTFEFKLDLETALAGTKIFDSDEISLFFHSESANEFVPDFGTPANYQFDLVSTYADSDFRLAKSPVTDYRVLSYNVLWDNLFDSSLRDEYQRIFSAIQPDIIGLQEVRDNSGLQAATLIEEFIPSLEGEMWYYGDAGADNLIVSRYPIIKQKKIDGSSSNTANANSAFLLDTGETYIFTIVAHPPCCGNDAGRQNEIDAFMAFLRDSQNGSEFDIPENTPIIIMGDMNLVGLSRQQTTLITGDIANEGSYGPDFNPDWDGSALEDAKPINPGLPTTFTWYSPNSSFGAGRLDYIVYSGSVLEMNNSFSLHTPSLYSDTLQAYGLEVNDTILASDHLPVVADFKFKTPTTSSIETERPSSFELAQNFPNPFNPSTTIPFTLDKASNINLSVHSINGSMIASLIDDEFYNSGEYSINFDASLLASGVYVYRLMADGEVQNKQMILIK